MLAPNDLTSRLKKNSLRLAHIFYDSNHLQTMALRLKKIFPRVTYIFLKYIHQQSVRSIDGITKKHTPRTYFFLKRILA
jgi:hypothetical protein